MKYLIPVFALFLLAACGEQQPNNATETSKQEGETIQTGWFGQEFEYDQTVTPTQVASLLQDGETNEFVVEGTIEECCQKKGCWMKVAMDNGESMRVSFKDYEFFVPMDAAGKTMVMKGVAMYDTIDVDFLKHLAEDANATQEEIDAITEPELALTFEATGVLIE